MQSSGAHHVLVRSLTPSFWNSCITIVNNLESSYRAALKGQCTVFNYHHQLDDYQIVKSIQDFKNNNVQEFIFIDHFPSFVKFFYALKVVYNDQNYPRISMHFYGDFAFRTLEYNQIESILKKCPIKLHAPSTRSKNFIEKHFKPLRKETLVTCPFPVSDKDFFVDRVERKKQRAALGIKEHQKVIVYTGRISSQKNVYYLAQVMKKILLHEKNIFFLMVGSFDNFATNLFGNTECRGTIDLLFSDFINALPLSLKKRFLYLGQQSHAQLRKTLNASDLYISLSTYHNEDFGMGPLEALFCGCPAILTNWGGYSDFFIDSKNVKLQNIALKGDGFILDEVKLYEDIINSSIRTHEERLKIAKKYSLHFSPASVAKILEVSLKSKYNFFKGFTVLTHHYAWILTGQVRLTPKEGTFYQTLYRDYYE